MIDPLVFIGREKEVKEIKGVFVFPPSVEEVLSTNNFSFYRQILTTSQEELEDLYTEKKKDLDNLPTPFEYLLQLYISNEELKQLVKYSFEFFLHEEVIILPEKKIILIGKSSREILKIKNINEIRFINEQNFFFLQNAIRMAVGEKVIEPPNPNEHPKIRRMKALARYRDKIKAKKGSGVDFGTTLVSICCMGIGLNPLNIGKISYASVSPIVRTFQEREKYDIDIRSLQAGAKAKDVKAKYWIRKIDD